MAGLIADNIDLNELVFAKKNKEYGAFKLRKAYGRNLNIGMWTAVFVTVLIALSPSIFKAADSQKDYVLVNRKAVQISTLAEPPSIGEAKKIEQVGALPPLQSTIKFVPPIVKPDDEIITEYFPTVDELKDVNPGTKTQEGMDGGILGSGGIGTGKGGSGSGSGSVQVYELSYVPTQILEVVPKKTDENISGYINLKLKIGIDGRVLDHIILENTTGSKDFLQNVITAVYKSRWKPVKINNSNIIYWIEKIYSIN